MVQTVSVLGINGRIGQEVARAFAAAGWQVTGMGREDRVRIEGVRFVSGDAANQADIARAIEGSEVVVNALNLPYDKWHGGRYEEQLRTVLAALRDSGKTLLYPGNIYNYGADQVVLRPDTPQRPEKDKGAIRVRLEQMLKAASGPGLQVVILRTGDFFSPGATGSNFDLVLMSRIKSHVLVYPSDPELGHSWAYLPDVARAYVKLAATRHALAPFETFHYRGHFATGHEMIAAMKKAIPFEVKVTRLPWGMLRLMGLFVPIIREVVKMSYLWAVPHRLEDKRLDDILGPDFETPFEEAMVRTTRSYLPPVEGKVSGKTAAA